MENKKKVLSRKKWIDLLQEGNAWCYIKPTMYRHDSGYRCFEVGYLTMEGNRCKEKLVLNTHSDHIQLYDYDFKSELHSKLMPNMDLLLDGYIRIFPLHTSKKLKYWWGSMDWVLSSAQLEELLQEEQDKLLEEDNE
jgi:hypothetical protein